MAKSVSLSQMMGTYHVSVVGDQTHLAVPKEFVDADGVKQTRTMFIPMTRMVVVLTSPKGGSVKFQAISMGKKTTVSRLTDLPVELVKNITPYGEAMITKPGSGKAQPIKLADAVATICRMTGVSPALATELFSFEAALVECEVGA